MKVRTEINSAKIASNLSNNQKLWGRVARQWHLYLTPYVPKDTGNLNSFVTIKPNRITYESDYAKEVYHSTWRNFRQDDKATGILRGAKWNDRAMNVEKPRLIRYIQKELKSVDI